jgi:hypothetical protein
VRKMTMVNDLPEVTVKISAVAAETTGMQVVETIEVPVEEEITVAETGITEAETAVVMAAATEITTAILRRGINNNTNYTNIYLMLNVRFFYLRLR